MGRETTEKEPERSVPERLSLSVAVLAGGESRRMGTDKALLDVEGEPLVVRVAARFDALSDDVFVVCKQPLELDVPEVLDEREDRTPLSGVITALRAARHARVFVCGCDMPELSPDLVAELASGTGTDVVVPRHAGRIEPLHCVWSTAALGALETAWDDGQRSVRGAIGRLDARYVDVSDASSFTNVNTPADLAAFSRPS